MNANGVGTHDPEYIETCERNEFVGVQWRGSLPSSRSDVAILMAILGREGLGQTSWTDVLLEIVLIINRVFTYPYTDCGVGCVISR